MDHTSINLNSRKRILLVEDDAAVRRSLQLVLAGDGYDVRAYAGPKGLANDVEAMQSSCLVADLILDGTDAIDLLRDMRGAGWMGPALLISGHLNDQRRAEAAEAGFDAVLEKPLLGGPLLKEVRRLIG